VTAELNLEAGIGRAPSNHAIGVDPVHRLVGQNTGLAERRTEEGGFAVLADPGMNSGKFFSASCVAPGNLILPP
jgi:hypothetical protein